MDIQMPEMDGLEVTKAIRNAEFGMRTRQDSTFHIPIIAVTGHAMQGDRERCLEAGMDDHISKPIKPDELFAAINRVIWAISTASEPRYRIEKHPPMDLKPAIDCLDGDRELSKELVDLFFSPSVLLVEDNLYNQKLILQFLKRSRCEVTLANNGQEALGFARDHRYDLILMDMQMPVMDGYTASREIRKIKGYNNVPIVAMTAYSPEEDQGKCLEAGCSECLPKPIRRRNFMDLLYKIFSERHVGTSDPEGSAPSGKEGDLFSEEFFDPEIREVAELYVNDFDERLAEAEALLKKQDQKELKAWIHNLKGVTGNLGLKALNLWAKNLDSLFKVGEFSWGRTEREIQEFKTLVVEIREVIEEMDEERVF